MIGFMGVMQYTTKLTSCFSLLESLPFPEHLVHAHALNSAEDGPWHPWMAGYGCDCNHWSWNCDFLTYFDYDCSSGHDCDSLTYFCSDFFAKIDIAHDDHLLAQENGDCVRAFHPAHGHVALVHGHLQYPNAIGQVFAHQACLLRCRKEQQSSATHQLWSPKQPHIRVLLDNQSPGIFLTGLLWHMNTQATMKNNRYNYKDECLKNGWSTGLYELYTYSNGGNSAHLMIQAEPSLNAFSNIWRRYSSHWSFCSCVVQRSKAPCTYSLESTCNMQVPVGISHSSATANSSIQPNQSKSIATWHKAKTKENVHVNRWRLHNVFLTSLLVAIHH